MLERIVSKENMQEAFSRVLGNKGCAGIDNMSIHELSNNIPIWFSEYPTANNSKVSPTKKSGNKVVYYPSCAARAMGTQPKARDQRSLEDVTISLLEKAGYQVIIPEDISKSCCGLPYESKGIDDIAQQEVRQLESILWQASNT